MSRFLQYRVYVGPRYLPSTESAYFDWSSIVSYGTDDLTYNSTLSVALASGATSLTLASGTGFPTKGGLWVGPTTAAGGWEYCGFTGRSTNTVSGLVRESTTYREHSGYHGIGAAVYVWYPLTANDGNLSFSYELTKNLSASYWTAELSGFFAPNNVLRNDHIGVIQYRTSPTGTWRNWLVGVTSDAHIQDDYTQYAKWEFKIKSLHSLLDTQESSGITLGNFNVAQYGRAVSSDPLGSASKERYSGDYVAAEPTFDAKNAISTDPFSMWIADRTVGTEVGIGSWEGVTQLYLNPDAGRTYALKWVELTNFSTEGEYFVTYDPATDTEYECDFDDYDPGTDYRIILTRDPYTFLAENPAYSGDKIVDTSTLGLGSNIWSGLLSAGGACGIKGVGGYRNCIRWGTCDHFPDGDGANSVDWDFNDNWTGAAIDAPDRNETLFFDHSVTSYTNDKDRWIVGYQNSPGYQINEDGDDAWLAVYLPGLGLYLRDDVATGSTSDIYIVDGAGKPSTNGLPSSGSLYVADDSITYTGKQADRVTGVSGVSSAHSAGDKVYVNQSGVATDGHPLSSIVLRYPGSNYADKFKLRFSRITSRVPTQSEHEDDYSTITGTTLLVPTGQAAASPFIYNVGGAYRTKTVLIEFQNMTTDPSRPRLLQLECNVDTSYYDSDLFLANSSAGAILSKLAQNASVPAAKIAVQTGGGIIKGVTTAADSAWTVIADFAEFAGMFVDNYLDSRLIINTNSLLTTPVGEYSPADTWTKADIARAEKVMVRGNGVSQVQLEWRSADGSDTGTAYYPSSPDWQGMIHEEGPLVFATEEAAKLAAQKKYFLLRHPYVILLELADVDLSVSPGDVYGLQWQFNDEFGEVDRLYLVTRVNQVIQNGVASTIVAGLQIDREVEF